MTMVHGSSEGDHPDLGSGGGATAAAPAEFLLTGETRLLELATAGTPLSETLDALCRFVEEVFAESRSSICLIDWRGPSARTGASPSLPAAFNDGFCALPVSDDAGPCGRAACSKRQVIAADLASDPAWQGSAFASLALTHGLRSCWSAPILSATGRVLGTVAIMHPLPAHPTSRQHELMGGVACAAGIAIEREQAEAAVAQARSHIVRMARGFSLGPLSPSIAHEVNQPLTGVIIDAGTCLRMLSADPPEVVGARETVRRMQRDARRIAELVGRLRSLYTDKEARTDQVDLNSVTREVLALSSSELQQRRIVVRLDLEDGLPPVMGDRVQLMQVILNLLMNACEAMSGVDERARLLAVITEREDGDRVRLSVQDSGIGLGNDTVARVFEPFYSTKPTGMGMGLFVSRSIMESHRGSLEAAPNRDGPGATFFFSLPCAVD
jgi:signal transduction histidine kinase